MKKLKRSVWMTWAVLITLMIIGWALTGFKTPTQASGSVPAEPAVPMVAHVGYNIFVASGWMLVVSIVLVIFVATATRKRN